MKDFVSWLLHSCRKVFPDSVFEQNILSGSAFANEPYMLTLAYMSHSDKSCHPVSLCVECDGAEVSVYKVGYVPVTRTDIGFSEVCTEGRDPGMYPDVLLGRNSCPEISENPDGRLPFYEVGENNLLTATKAWQSVFVVINEDAKILKGGQHTLNVRFASLLDGTVLSEHKFTLNVIDKCLPETRLKYTNWFHYDSLCHIHGADYGGERYFQILEKYISNAARNGMNMLLTPFFTPPLDTCIGRERMCTQLVGVEKKGEDYIFDFSLAERFVKLALDCGIKYIEHSHLFTQWGAEHTPNIYAKVNGEHRRIFGWDADASGKEYAHFLSQYIPALTEFMKSVNCEDRLFFHISDEPTADNEHTYKKAVDVVASLLEGYPGGDALEDIVFYHKKFVKTPIVSISKADEFFGRCPDYWLYYTGGYYDGSGLEKCSNRLLTSKPCRTRILGLHLYRYKATGFLHWGYNYYYDRMTTGLCNPATDACFYKQLPGAAYLAYPGNDTVYPSLREKYMLEAINDHRALCLLEEYIGYDGVTELCNEFFGQEISVNTMPENGKRMIEFREMINSEIQKYI